MLVELAVGDAYGAGFEFSPDDMIRRHNKARYYVQHPRHDIRPGCYTDDTQMTLAIVEALLSDEAWTAENLAERFVAVYRRDPRHGYAGRFHAFLQTVRDGPDLLARIQADSDRSGAAMCAAPLGLLPTIDEVLDRCRVQAVITHNTPDGVDAALAAPLMTYSAFTRSAPSSGCRCSWKSRPRGVVAAVVGQGRRARSGKCAGGGDGAGARLAAERLAEGLRGFHW